MHAFADIHAHHSIHTILHSDEWRHKQKEHVSALSPILQPYLEKRSQQIKDPVLDFLFEYYHFRPSHLEKWSPGYGTGLLIKNQPLPELSELKIDTGVAYLDPVLFPDNRRKSMHWILDLLEKSSRKDPSFGCFGMHEWAMVYKAGNVRHNQIPLRMKKSELAEFVESRPLVCTHFDAFRFFTGSARPMNKYTLSRETFADNEQPGCIHTNMDLYKWGFKMYPWISSNVIRKAFLLAVEARTVDMQASPYDLRSKGLEPIRIETESGRREYLERQRDIYEKGEPVRNQLISEYRKLADI